MACMAIFAHMYENFVRVAPNVDFFRHFFIPRIEYKNHRSGNVIWIPRGNKEDKGYLPGQCRGKWEEWRGDWCWIMDAEALEFCSTRTDCVLHGNDSSSLGLSDDRLRTVLNRVTCLKGAGLTIQHVGADFLRRRIAPLQKRDMFSWEFNGRANWMRLYPGRAAT
ncbi:hypothetical protein D1007_12323 [Hordeum vulgare]|nr:hypothetical protein D1007_12323 [Hordeum vulgare]